MGGFGMLLASYSQKLVLSWKLCVFSMANSMAQQGADPDF